MAQQSQGHAIADIYKGVINDVINQVKEAFLDENVDVDVLSQLRKDWEEKVNSSGCVDMDTRHPAHTQHVPPANIRTMAPNAPPARVTIPAAPRIQPHNLPPHLEVQNRAVTVGEYVHQQHQQQQHQQQQQQQQNIGQLQHAIQSNQLGIGAFPTNQPRMVSAIGGQLPQYINTVNTNVMFIPSNGQQVPIAMGPNMGQPRVQLNPGQVISQIHQVDGSSDRILSSEEERTARRKSAKKQANISRKEAEKVARQLGLLQLDGGGGMSDSSSDDEDEDPLSSIVNIGDANVEDGENVTEEDPLNSGDDQSDDEDLETLFDAENVIMCQFEKVHRARSKWKFQLKDGIMHIDNRDYCFQKCTGEAEW